MSKLQINLRHGRLRLCSGSTKELQVSHLNLSHRTRVTGRARKAGHTGARQHYDSDRHVDLKRPFVFQGFVSTGTRSTGQHCRGKTCSVIECIRDQARSETYFANFTHLQVTHRNEHKSISFIRWTQSAVKIKMLVPPKRYLLLYACLSMLRRDTENRMTQQPRLVQSADK